MASGRWKIYLIIFIILLIAYGAVAIWWKNKNGGKLQNNGVEAEHFSPPPKSPETKTTAEAKQCNSMDNTKEKNGKTKANDKAMVKKGSSQNNHLSKYEARMCTIRAFERIFKRKPTEAEIKRYSNLKCEKDIKTVMKKVKKHVPHTIKDDMCNAIDAASDSDEVSDLDKASESDTASESDNKSDSDKSSESDTTSDSNNSSDSDTIAPPESKPPASKPPASKPPASKPPASNSAGSDTESEKSKRSSSCGQDPSTKSNPGKDTASCPKRDKPKKYKIKTCKGRARGGKLPDNAGTTIDAWLSGYSYSSTPSPFFPLEHSNKSNDPTAMRLLRGLNTEGGDNCQGQDRDQPTKSHSSDCSSNDGESKRGGNKDRDCVDRNKMLTRLKAINNDVESVILDLVKNTPKL
jgi:hypothetical protein